MRLKRVNTKRRKGQISENVRRSFISNVYSVSKDEGVRDCGFRISDFGLRKGGEEGRAGEARTPKAFASRWRIEDPPSRSRFPLRQGYDEQALACRLGTCLASLFRKRSYANRFVQVKTVTNVPSFLGLYRRSPVRPNMRYVPIRLKKRRSPSALQNVTAVPRAEFSLASWSAVVFRRFWIVG